MAAQIFIGIFAEGTTDLAFLEPVVEKTFNDILYREGQGVYDPIIEKIVITKTGKKSFIEQVEAAAQQGFDEFGMMILCVHTDADAPSAADTYAHKINPMLHRFTALDNSKYCKNIVPIIPIYETESWLLADKALFKEQIGTDKSDADLGISGNPERLNQPKEAIENAIRLALENYPKRRRNLTIGDLYSPIGAALSISELEPFASFQDFKDKARTALRAINVLH